MKRTKLAKASKQTKPKLKKKTAYALMKEYGMPYASKSNLRYKNPIEKGIAWFWFAHYIRLRDCQIWGTCISCGKTITFDNTDAGHFIAASNCGLDLLMDERNVNAEHSGCNAYDQNHLLGYEKNLDIRYGAGTAAKLKERYFSQKIVKISNWGEIALKYKNQYGNTKVE